MNTKNILFVFSFLSCLVTSANALGDKGRLNLEKMIFVQEGDTLFLQVDEIKCDSIVKEASKKEVNKKKFISALFAFPFPLGFMGAHRVMLGTKPWVPVVYAATFGGCFGVLPLIDFFVITFSKDIEQYENNPNIFMWLK